MTGKLCRGSKGHVKVATSQNLHLEGIAKSYALALAKNATYNESSLFGYRVF